MASDRMTVLFVSNLFPNPCEPNRGVFNAYQVAALARLCSVKVVAPSSRRLPQGIRDGLSVCHPRFWHVPLLSRPFNGWLFARAIEATLRAERFDIVLVNFAYPDAYGVMLLAKRYGFRFATTVLGSDVNTLFRHRGRKRQVLRALRASSAVFARSQALQARLATEGIRANVVYNGINRGVFVPRARAAACRQLGVPEDRRRILFVGHLVSVKGPIVLAHAFEELADLADLDLFFLGAGNQADALTTSPRVSLLGERPHDEVAAWISACDLVCIPSLSEGLPNVALEALACGRPVVASHVGGLPEIIRNGENGFLVPPENPGALADALRRALGVTWDVSQVCASVASFDWKTNARTVVSILERALR